MYWEQNSNSTADFQLQLNSSLHSPSPAQNYIWTQVDIDKKQLFSPRKFVKWQGITFSFPAGFWQDFSAIHKSWIKLVSPKVLFYMNYQLTLTWKNKDKHRKNLWNGKGHLVSCLVLTRFLQFCHKSWIKSVSDSKCCFVCSVELQTGIDKKK
jgi:hypothetical protein